MLKSQKLSVFIDPNLDKNYHAIQLILNEQMIIMISPSFAQSHNFNAQLNWESLNWYGTDQVFYYDIQRMNTIKQLPKLYLIRPLTQDDQQIFYEFCQNTSSEDLENAFVSLDHWLVYGVFVYGKLVSVASMYLWDKDEYKIADVSVVTSPKFRQQGHAKRLIRSISQAAILSGYAPQYRCQLNNVSSLALAQSAGLSPLLQWDVVLAN